MAAFPENNRSWQILHAAAKGGYAVGAYNWYVRPKLWHTGSQPHTCTQIHTRTHTHQLTKLISRSYNDDGVISVIRAAERCKSPAIIQLFPWTIKFQGPHFVRYVVGAAHAASVPIAVHLDHCIEPEDVETALELPFDSIMVDASTMEPEDNIKSCREIVRRANAKGIAIEAEMGRIEGGEDGLPNVDLESIMTRPEQARDFVRETGVQFLAPAFGNIHGSYDPRGPEATWNLSL